MIDPSAAPSSSTPRAFALVHLEQPLLDARVNAGGDDSLDFHAFAREEVLVVAVTIVRGDATGVPQGGSGPVTHGVFGARARYATRVRFRTEPHRTGRAGSARQLCVGWRQGLRELHACACRVSLWSGTFCDKVGMDKYKIRQLRKAV